jgi:hypothetical protein
VENRSPFVENKGARGVESSKKKNLLLIPYATMRRGSKIDGDGFQQYLLAQGNRNWNLPQPNMVVARLVGPNSFPSNRPPFD